MGVVHSGKRNPNWRGGRSISSHGYVLIRVGKHHHLSDVRGYAYEHRIVAEQKLGRRLLPDEEPHHIDENKQNNHPDNLEIVTKATHQSRHRKHDKGLRDHGEPNPEVSCECGCGSHFLKFDQQGRPRRFLPSHNAKRGLDGRFSNG